MVLDSDLLASLAIVNPERAAISVCFLISSTEWRIFKGVDSGASYLLSATSTVHDSDHLAGLAIVNPERAAISICFPICSTEWIVFLSVDSGASYWSCV